jgi:hypothetical protein
MALFCRGGVPEGGIGYLIPHDGDPRQLSSSAISRPEVDSLYCSPRRPEDLERSILWLT